MPDRARASPARCGSSRASAFPPGRGQAIGSVVVGVPGMTVGVVPLLVTAVDPPPALEEDRPWWRRAFGALVEAGGALLEGVVRLARLLASPPMSDVISVLFAREDIRRRIEELGRTITGDYDGRAPVLISVLRGGSVFLADLIREIFAPAVDRLHVDLAVRRCDGVDGARAHRQGSRGRHRRSRRDRRRGHRRHRADAELPPLGAGFAWTRVGRGLHAARQDRTSDRAARAFATAGSSARTSSSSATGSTSTSVTVTSPTSLRCRMFAPSTWIPSPLEAFLPRARSRSEARRGAT